MSRATDLRTENRRLKSVIAAIHNYLHADDVNAAHDACECALSGSDVTQPNLSTADSARVMTFATEFNAAADRHKVRACCILLLPSTTVQGATSLQLLGEVAACKVIETMLRGAPSTYMGDHGTGR